jgi:hypothetical protein
LNNKLPQQRAPEVAVLRALLGARNSGIAKLVSVETLLALAQGLIALHQPMQIN